MSEIDKLYKNCGFIETIKHHHFREHRVKAIPFTPEKQIKLIKWLANTKHYIQSISMTYDGKKYYVENERYNGIASSFEEALAEVVNELWQSLTEEERQQVKGILE